MQQKTFSFNSIKISKKKKDQINNLIISEYKKKNINIKKKINSEIVDLPDLRTNKKLTLKLENLLKDEIISLLPKEKKNSFSLQYPFNIRLSYQKINKRNLYSYSTNKLHSDVWSGAPLHSRNFIFYNIVSSKSSYCKVYETLRGDKKYENFKGDYSNINIEKNKLKEIKYKPISGLLISFDSLCPHKTFYPKKFKKFTSIRLSMDFRVKFGNPYFEKNKKVNYNKFVISKKGQPGLGYYWTLQKKKFRNLNQKIQNELRIAKKLSNKIYLMRYAYLKDKKMIK